MLGMEDGVIAIVVAVEKGATKWLPCVQMMHLAADPPCSPSAENCLLS